jgi:peptidylprolyl isomerase
MTQAKHGDRVGIHYTGRLADGTVFDERHDALLSFTLGAEEVIPGFDQAVTGMATGEKKTVTIPAGDAYGEREEELMFPVPRSQFPPDIAPAVGMQLAIQAADGQTIPVRVCDVDEMRVILDANHPLAGQALTFDIQLMEIVVAPA